MITYPNRPADFDNVTQNGIYYQKYWADPYLALHIPAQIWTGISRDWVGFGVI